MCGDKTRTWECRGSDGQNDSRKRAELSSSVSFCRGMRRRNESIEGIGFSPGYGGGQL